MRATRRRPCSLQVVGRMSRMLLTVLLTHYSPGSKISSSGRVLAFTRTHQHTFKMSVYYTTLQFCLADPNASACSSQALPRLLDHFYPCGQRLRALPPSQPCIISAGVVTQRRCAVRPRRTNCATRAIFPRDDSYSQGLSLYIDGCARSA